MTEYDYSPEAYERYMATQHRIANWVDQTEHYRPQFEPAAPGAPPGSVTLPQHQHQQSSPRHHTQKGHRPPTMDLYRPYDKASPPSSSSSSSFVYPAGSPGPTPYAGPSPIYAQQPAYQTFAPPLISPMYSAPIPQKRSHHSKSHKSRRSHSHHSPTYDYVVATPAPSPAYAYGYPTVPPVPPNMGATSPGYVVLPRSRYAQNQNIMYMPQY
ncbi:hypothetical protein BDQ17DRAFT_1320080 [Cyathus striatus]|nr:hypothetical protein BDQ17DRAFT_1320080 [Cyathus striatus]